MRTLACRAYWTALEGRPGAVHLNFPLREPLVSDERAARATTAAAPTDAPYVARAPRPARLGDGAQPTRACERLVRGSRRGVRGRRARRAATAARPRAAAAFASAAGWPLLADPLSGARRGEAAIAHYDALLRDQRLRAPR